MLNKIFLQGRLVADPEMRVTQNGVAVSSFRLAVERDYKDKESGEKQVDFINVVAWRQTGEFVARYFSKGRMALVDGRLQIRDYLDRDGNKRTIAEVVADTVYFGDSKPSTGGDTSNTYQEAQTPEQGDPFEDLHDEDGALPF